MKEIRRGPATLREVAALAKVSPTVVSRVLHGKAAGVRVSSATAERVLQAATELQYRRNALASSLRGSRTMAIAVVHSGGVTRPRFSTGSRYFSALMDGIVDTSFAHDLSLTLCPKLLGEHPSEGLSDGRFDGLIWYRFPESDLERSIMERSGLPQVLIHPSPEASCPSVGCENRSGMDLILGHLSSLGHRRVGFVIEPWHMRGEGRIRQDAFIQAARSYGFQNPEESVHRFEGVLPSALGQEGETAVLAWSESTAGALLELLTEKGVRVPEDLSLAGFDSTSFCDELRPRLTAVAQPLWQIGSQAVELLVRLIAGETDLPRTTLLPCRLDVRDSTGPPASR